MQLGGGNPFSKNPVDQACEETVNKDTPRAGGTKGFSLNPGEVSRYYMVVEQKHFSQDTCHYLSEVTHLKEEHPEVLVHFMSEGFLCNLVGTIHLVRSLMIKPERRGRSRQSTIVFSKQKAKQRRNKLADIENKLRKSELLCATEPTEKSTENLEKVKIEYDSMYDYITQGNIIQSRATWHEKGEKIINTF